MSTQAESWLTIREAALALGVSELTIRRRIKDGKVESRSTNGKYYIRDPRQSAPPSSGPPRQVSTQRGSRRMTTHTSDDEAVSDHDYSDRAEYTDIQSMNRPASYPSSPAIDLDGLLSEHRRLAELAGRAQALEQQVQELRERSRELETGVVSLSNRNGWLESKLEERDQAIKLLTDSRRRVPWWKRVFRLAAEA
jgi:excisionase family DNA binding protein